MVKKYTNKISRSRVSRRMSRPRVSRRMRRPRVSRRVRRGRILNYIRTTNTHIVDLFNLIEQDTGLDRKQMDLYNETIGSIADLSNKVGSQSTVLNYTLKEIQDKIHERKKILKFTLVLNPDIWSSVSLRHADSNSKYAAKDERYYKKQRQSYERYTRPFVLREIARRQKARGRW